MNRASTLSDPTVSVVIPVYNEEGLMETAIRSLRNEIEERFDWSYEILIAENGSTDRTRALAKTLSESFEEVHTFSVDEPNYGKALKEGILRCRGKYVICDEIDLCDVSFYASAIRELDAGVEFVVGSKMVRGAEDTRPLYRHLASGFYNGLLRASMGYRGTDTHGLKAFARAPLEPVVRTCILDRDVFASELVIRAFRADLSVLEVPVRIVEKRRPSIALFRRVPNVLRGLVRLRAAIGKR